ncbi:4787_t:CDS:2 [Funneliformis geosporum]|uniref:4787_t:CDS:1 n=1 Tax=Funneliformis geosporum TaxID=1117311 RepID=A0A9W4SS73_9GLOM|nr:4787_t:CDS:2 [Funneliformis geosporum]
MTAGDYAKDDPRDVYGNEASPEYEEDFSYEKEDRKKIVYWVKRAVGQFLDAFESEYNPIQQVDYPLVSLGEKVHLRRRNKDKNILIEQLERANQTDLLSSTNAQNDMLEKFQGRNRDT